MQGGYKVIVLCTSRVYDHQVHGFIRTLNESLKSSGCRLWIYALNADLYWAENPTSAEIAVFDAVPYDIADAVVIMDEKIKSHEIAEQIIGRASERDIPVIVVDGHYEGTAGISFDFTAGFENIVRHVIECHGARRLHMLAGIEGNVFSDERIEVFRNVLAEYGLEYDDSMLSYGEFWATPARAAVQKLVDRGDIPDALICANDIMAINAVGVLVDAGYRVPEDVIVTGFDGYDEAFMSIPGITTACCGSSEMADTVYQTVMDALEGRPLEDRVVMPRMVANESCGCPRCMELNMSAMQRFNDAFYRYQDDIRDQHVIATRMLTSRTADELSSCIRDVLTKNMCCIIYEDCFDQDVYYFGSSAEKTDRKFCILFDSDSREDRVTEVTGSQLVPNVDIKLESGQPLIFNAIDYMNRSLGYVCYSYKDYDITDYSKTANLTDMVSVGLGGYINMRYQQYLLSRVEEIYRIDALTGLYNRLAFGTAFEKIKNAPENEGKPMTVIMADLDRLKIINDTLGHNAGDRAIASVAEALRNACPDDALCVRFGGDEMLAFIPGCDNGRPIIDAINEKLAKTSAKLGYQVSASCGECTKTISPDMNMGNIIRSVDRDMYNVKQNR